MEELKRELSLSKLTLGTMRFFDKFLSKKQVIDLIEACFDKGITTHHSSFEYSSYSLYTNSLKETSAKKHIKHIVKLSSPHFEDDSFSETILEQRVDNQLKALNIDCIDVLQWLVRSKPINDEDRLKTLQSQSLEIKQALSTLQKKGKVKSVFSFPYSVPFAEEAIKRDEVQGIISYLNKEELDYSKLAKQYPFIAIRPHFAGKLLDADKNINEQVDSNLSFIQNFENVLTTVVSINSTEQLQSYKNKHII